MPQIVFAASPSPRSNSLIASLRTNAAPARAPWCTTPTSHMGRPALARQTATKPCGSIPRWCSAQSPRPDEGIAVRDLAREPTAIGLPDPDSRFRAGLRATANNRQASRTASLSAMTSLPYLNRRHCRLHSTRSHAGRPGAPHPYPLRYAVTARGLPLARAVVVVTNSSGLPVYFLPDVEPAGVVSIVTYVQTRSPLSIARR